jgi:hypothetical protein
MTNAKAALMPSIGARAAFFVAVLAIFAWLCPAQAASNLGGGSLGFECDADRQKCECKGISTGADCQAMAKNCGKNKIGCIEPPESPVYKCFCDMGMKKRKPNTVAPGLNEAPVLKEMAPQ